MMVLGAVVGGASWILATTLQSLVSQDGRLPRGSAAQDPERTLPVAYVFLRYAALVVADGIVSALFANQFFRALRTSWYHPDLHLLGTSAAFGAGTIAALLAVRSLTWVLTRISQDWLRILVASFIGVVLQGFTIWLAFVIVAFGSLFDDHSPREAFWLSPITGLVAVSMVTAGSQGLNVVVGVVAALANLFVIDRWPHQSLGSKAKTSELTALEKTAMRELLRGEHPDRREK
jgi:hypothetical protein